MTEVTDQIEDCFKEFYTTEVAHRVKIDRDFKKTKPNNLTDPAEEGNQSFSFLEGEGDV